MAVRIRLKRVGKIHYPVYRIVVVDGRKKRDGRVIEEVGQYNPNEEPSFYSGPVGSGSVLARRRGTALGRSSPVAGPFGRYCPLQR